MKLTPQVVKNFLQVVEQTDVSQAQLNWLISRTEHMPKVHKRTSAVYLGKATDKEGDEWHWYKYRGRIFFCISFNHLKQD